MATEPGHATEVTTAYPLPPKYFSLYTDANVAEFPEYQRDRAETDKAQDAFSKAVTAATAGLEDSSKSISASAGSAPKYLHPPRPIEGAYSMFGADHTTDSKLKTLRELGIPQFFPDGPIEYKPVLKNLIQSLLADLHKYLEILGTRTEEFEPQKDRIWHLLQNIHHVINEYRPHQARDMLCLVMEEDIRKKQDMAKRLQEFCAQTREEMQQAQRELISEPDVSREEMEVDKSPDHAADSSDATQVSSSLERYKQLQRRLAEKAKSVI